MVVQFWGRLRSGNPTWKNLSFVVFTIVLAGALIPPASASSKGAQNSKSSHKSPPKIRHQSATAPAATPSTQTVSHPFPVSETSRLLALKGIRYSGRWTPPGERSPWVMDCSNTCRYLFHRVAGVELPRTAHDQYEFLKQQRRVGEIPPDDRHNPRKLEHFLSSRLQPGDLLFWTDGSRKTHISHVMVYLGKDPEGRPVIAGSEHTKGVNLYHFDPHTSRTGHGRVASKSRRRGGRLSFDHRQRADASRLFAYGRVL